MKETSHAASTLRRVYLRPQMSAFHFSKYRFRESDHLQLSLLLNVVNRIGEQTLGELDGLVELLREQLHHIRRSRALRGALGRGGGGLGDDRLGRGDAVDANQLCLEDCR